MLATLFVDPPMLLFLGHLFAFGIPLTSTVPIGKSRALVAGLVTLTIFNAAVVISYLWFPDWMWMYTVQASAWGPLAHRITLVLTMVAYYALFGIGFYWGVVNRARDPRKALRMLGMLLAFSVVVIIPVFKPYFHVGTWAQYYNHHAVPIPDSTLAPVYNFAVPLMLIVGGLLFRWARNERG